MNNTFIENNSICSISETSYLLSEYNVFMESLRYNKATDKVSAMIEAFKEWIKKCFTIIKKKFDQMTNKKLDLKGFNFEFNGTKAKADLDLIYIDYSSLLNDIEHDIKIVGNIIDRNTGSVDPDDINNTIRKTLNKWSDINSYIKIIKIKKGEEISAKDADNVSRFKGQARDFSTTKKMCLEKIDKINRYYDILIDKIKMILIRKHKQFDGSIDNAVILDMNELKKSMDLLKRSIMVHTKNITKCLSITENQIRKWAL